MTPLETTQLTDLKTMIDDAVGQSYTKMYADLRLAFASSAQLGDTLSVRMSQQFPDKFPGDASISAVDARVALNELLLEHSYLTTMASDAGVAGRASESAAGLGSIASVRADLAPVMGFLMGPDARSGFTQLWGIRDADVLAYANSGDAATRERLTGSLVTQLANLLHAPSATVADQLTATLKTIDDQRAKTYKNVPVDDQAAAAAMRTLADKIA
jgi:hypothetical protein